MNMLYYEYRGFSIQIPETRILGTVHPVFAEIKIALQHPELESHLEKRSGDLVEGNSPKEAIDNAKRRIDQFLASAPVN